MYAENIAASQAWWWVHTTNFNTGEEEAGGQKFKNHFHNQFKATLVYLTLYFKTGKNDNRNADTIISKLIMVGTVVFLGIEVWDS